MKTPCQVEPDLWVSESEPDRIRAKRACTGCHRLVECLTEAIENRETWGVWGGRDFTRARVNVPPKPCPECGDMFHARRNEGLTDWHRRSFCSRTCANRNSHKARMDAKAGAA